MATGTLTVSATAVGAGGHVTLTVAIMGFDGDTTVTLTCDNDPDDSSGWQNVTLDKNGGAEIGVTLAAAGSYTFTLNIDGNPAVDDQNNAITAGPVTVSAPATTTTAPPLPATTTAPPTTTTAAPRPPPTTTTAPASTTTAAPSGTTTAAPSGTTTAAPSGTTTAAPAGTTTAASSGTTTAAPAGTTTAAPAGTTTAAPSGTTTAAPAGTTTAAPSGTTTAAPAGTTTAATGGTTTAAPGGTTTAAPGGGAPGFDDGAISITIDPTDDTTQHPNSVQVSTDAKLKLVWKASNAKSVRIDPLGDQDASGSVGIPAEDATYSLVAVGDGGESAPFSIEVHTHAPGEVVSPHVAVSTGLVKILSLIAMSNGAPVGELAPGTAFTVTAVFSDATESATINGTEITLSETDDNQKTGSLEVASADPQQAEFTCQASHRSGVAGEEQSITVHISSDPTTTTTAPTTSTTAAPTTTAPSSTTTTQPATSTTAEPISTTTTAAPSTTTPAGDAPTISTFEVDTSNLADQDSVVLSWKIDSYSSSVAVALAVDRDPDGNGTAPAITTDATGAGTLTAKLTYLGVFTYTLSVTPEGGQAVTKTVTVTHEPQLASGDFTAAFSDDNKVDFTWTKKDQTLVDGKKDQFQGLWVQITGSDDTSKDYVIQEFTPLAPLIDSGAVTVTFDSDDTATVTATGVRLDHYPSGSCTFNIWIVAGGEGV
jgi:hypothetical protein